MARLALFIEAQQMRSDVDLTNPIDWVWPGSRKCRRGGFWEGLGDFQGEHCTVRQVAGARSRSGAVFGLCWALNPGMSRNTRRYTPDGADTLPKLSTHATRQISNSDYQTNVIES
jgi:hypothetical protein